MLEEKKKRKVSVSKIAIKKEGGGSYHHSVVMNKPSERLKQTPEILKI